MRKALHPGATRFFHFQVLLLGLVFFCLLATILTSLLKDIQQDQKPKLYPVEINRTSLQEIKSFLTNRDLVITYSDPGLILNPILSSGHDLPGETDFAIDFFRTHINLTLVT